MLCVVAALVLLFQCIIIPSLTLVLVLLIDGLRETDLIARFGTRPKADLSYLLDRAVSRRIFYAGQLPRDGPKER